MNKLHYRSPFTNKIYCGARGPSIKPAFLWEEKNGKFLWGEEVQLILCKRCPKTKKYKQDKQDTILQTLADV